MCGIVGFNWKDEKDRAEKMEKYTDRMTKDFVKVFDQAAKTIGEGNRCIGRVVTSGDVPPASAPVENDDEFSFD